ncbi:MAG TPA: WGxxGxxG family protein [Sphingomicrobium sp.]|nr:WGxxGxxG family protein [Sphingomicrobium sp.]
MRRKWMLAVLVVAASASPAAWAQPAQRDTGVRTETQERLRMGDAGFDWNWLGFLGLLGLLGLRREHSEDSYHPASLE